MGVKTGKIFASTITGLKQHANKIKNTWSGIIWFPTWTTGQWYLIVRGITGYKLSKAPRLNLIIWVLLEVEPSGKIIKGDLFDYPIKISFWRSTTISTVFCFASADPPLGQNIPSDALTKYPTIGIFSIKSAAKYEISPSKLASQTGISENPTWFET